MNLPTAEPVLENAPVGAALSAEPGGDQPAGERSQDHSRKRVIHGSVYTIIGYATNNVLRMVSSVVLAGMLLKSDYGVMALVGAVLSGLQMFSDLGIGPAIVQSKREVDRTYLNTAWTIQIVRSVGLFLAATALAWPMARFYGEPGLVGLLPFAALSVLVSGFNSTSWFTADRRLAVFKLVLIDLVAQVAAIVTMVVWARISPSPYALGAGAIVGNSVKMLASHWALEGWIDRIGWDRTSYRELMHFGRWIFFSTAVTFLWYQADRLAVGKLFTVSTLGVYWIALQLARMPIDVITKLTGVVLFPMLSIAHRDDTETLRSQFYLARQIMLPPALCVAGAIALFSPPFFLLAYKEAFHDAAWITPAMSLAIWFEILQVATDRVLLSRGDTRGLFVSNLLRAVVGISTSIGGYWIGGMIEPVRGPMLGFLAGITLGSIAGHAWVQVCCRRAGLPILRSDARYTAYFLAMLAAGFGLSALVSSLLPGTFSRVWTVVLSQAFPAALVVSIPAIISLRRILPIIRKQSAPAGA